MTTIHWLGAGLSSVPGIRRLAGSTMNMHLWNRTLSRAEAAIEGLDSNVRARELDWQELATVIEPGDVLVSMLPGTLHLQTAELCLNKSAHFISSSYITPQMLALDDRAKHAGLAFVNEVGLDPGIDHLLAHALVNDYKNSAEFDPANRHSFRSYCGGFPKIPNDFTYKFSWSPLGVLKALKSEARWLQNGQEMRSATPWKVITPYEASVGRGGREEFEAYPNRDSLPFMQQYGFTDNWDTWEFVRGTLRLKGWTKAWQHLFDEIETLEGEAGEARLSELSRQLWEQYAYEPDEIDRVVLCVELKVCKPGNPVPCWHQSYDIDECGNENGSAMARLVSNTVSLAVESVLQNQIAAGVTAAPDDMNLVNDWLGQLVQLGESIPRQNRI